MVVGGATYCVYGKSGDRREVDRRAMQKPVVWIGSLGRGLKFQSGEDLKWCVRPSAKAVIKSAYVESKGRACIEKKKTSQKSKKRAPIRSHSSLFCVASFFLCVFLFVSGSLLLSGAAFCARPLFFLFCAWVYACSFVRSSLSGACLSLYLSPKPRWGLLLFRIEFLFPLLCALSPPFLSC